MENIRLVVNGKDLDLAPGFTVEREEESSIFNRELNRKDFTYPATIPLTENNDVAFGLISNLAVASKKKEFLADFYYNGIYDNQVTILILNVSTVTKTIEMSIIGTYGTFARVIGNVKLATLQLGGDRIVGSTLSDSTITLGTVHYVYDLPDGTPADDDDSYIELTTNYYACTTPDHMKDVMLGNVVTDYYFYPSFDNKANIHKLNDEGSNLINFYDWGLGVFADPIVEYYKAEMMVKIDQRLFWVPFFKTLYVLRRCFEEFGFKVSGDIFSDPAFQKSTLYNTATFCSYKTHETEWEDEEITGGFAWFKTITISNRSTVIHPQDHMPDITVLEFINEIAKAWNLQYRIDLKQQTVVVIQLKTFKNNAPVVDFSSKSYPVYDISLDENDLTDGYKFVFSPDSAESYLGTKQIEELGDYPVVAAVNKLEDLTATYEVNDLAYVRRDNSYYQFGGTDWGYYSYNSFMVQSITDKENPVEIKTKAIPLVNDDVSIIRTIFDPTAPNNVGKESKSLLLPRSTTGVKGRSLIAMKYPSGGLEVLAAKIIFLVDSAPINIPPILVNYHGMQPNAGVASYPYGASYNYNTLGVSLSAINHFWDSPDHNGLYNTQWKVWTDSLLSAIPVKFNVLLTGAQEDFYDYETIIMLIFGQHYVVKKTNKPLPYPNVSVFELIRI